MVNNTQNIFDFNEKTLNKKLVSDSKVYTNLGQEFIVTTEDKIRIKLDCHLNKIALKKDWITPVGIFLTVLLTLLTTEFKKFYFSADTWTAVFLIIEIITGIWSLVSIIKALRTEITVDHLINEIKKGSLNSEKNKENNNYNILLESYLQQYLKDKK